MTAVPGIATELHVFSAGQAAKAQEVNDNFQRLDTAIQNRATKAGLESTDGALKSVMATVGTLQTGKADVSTLAQKADTGSVSKKADASWVTTQLSGKAAKADLDALSAKQKTDAAMLAKATVDSAVNLRNAIPAAVDVSGKANTSWVRDTLKVKADTSRVASLEKIVVGKQSALGFMPANKAGDSFTGDVIIDKALTVVGMVSAGGFQTGGAVTAATIQIGGKDVWHTGNLSSDLLFYERGNAPASWATLTINGSYSVRPENYDGPAGYYNFGDIAVFGNGTMKTQVYHSHHGEVLVRTKWNEGDWNSWARTWTSLNFDPTKYVLASGGTITGDLRISGKLTTPPGATPADYVFEPDYKLAPLSEVEAFTKANRHLPEVPSAKEMTENGVDMAAMNMVLLKKVEELTLHAIALQKDLEAQKAQFEQRLQRLESTSR